MKLKGIDLWAYLDTGSGRNLISKEDIYRLGLKPVSHKSHQIVTVNGTKKESLPVFRETIDSVDHKVSEKIQITIIKTPTLIELKAKSHVQELDEEPNPSKTLATCGTKERVHQKFK